MGSAWESVPTYTFILLHKHMLKKNIQIIACEASDKLNQWQKERKWKLEKRLQIKLISCLQLTNPNPNACIIWAIHH